MRTTRILAIFFVAVYIFETFYPLGDFICYWFGDFGRISGNILALGGFGSLAWEIGQISERFEAKNNVK